MSQPSDPSRKLFGTDGIRGVANLEPVTAETALRLGRAAAHVFTQHGAPRASNSSRPTIVIGKDTRVSGYMLENALAAGVMSLGANVIFIGPLPTPGVAYITRSLRADAGIVLSASHNPYEDNGIKFFRHDGYKLDDAVERRIEHLVFSGEIEQVRPTAGEIGRAKRVLISMPRKPSCLTARSSSASCSVSWRHCAACLAEDEEEDEEDEAEAEEEDGAVGSPAIV